jgi:hypothetical protein
LIWISTWYVPAPFRDGIERLYWYLLRWAGRGGRRRVAVGTGLALPLSYPAREAGWSNCEDI